MWDILGLCLLFISSVTGFLLLPPFIFSNMLRFDVVLLHIPF